MDKLVWVRNRGYLTYYTPVTNMYGTFDKVHLWLNYKSKEVSLTYGLTRITRGGINLASNFPTELNLDKINKKIVEINSKKNINLPLINADDLEFIGSKPLGIFFLY